MGEVWRLRGFTELAELGSGAQGRVVLARRDGEDGTVAIKYLAPELLADAASLAVFRGEATVLARITDPHVATLYGYVEEAAGAAILMEAVDGTSLRRILDAHGALSPEAALVVLKGALLGLAAAHRSGIVHRDFKPANVMVEPDGNSKLIDFGIAVLRGQGGRSGTPAYMAPEQWQGAAATSATDLYAATCVFFECVTGRPPYRGVSIEALRAQHVSGPPPTEALPEALAPLALRGMAKDPAERSADAEEFVSELEEVAAGEYGRDWEAVGLRALAGSTAALATGAVAVVGKSGILAKIGGWKVAAGVAAAGSVTIAVTGVVFWPSDDLAPAWDTRAVRPASGVVAVDGGFVLYGHDGLGGFEAVGLEAESGRVRWRDSATPSANVHGVGLYMRATERTAYYMRPVGPPATRMAELVAADAGTGRQRWTYGSEGLLFVAPPSLCAAGRICVSVFRGPSARSEVLDAESGRLLSSSPTVDGRALGRVDDGETAGVLYVSREGGDLMLVSVDGRVRWRKPAAELFGTEVTPDMGWHIQDEGGVFAGQLGRPGFLDRGTGVLRLDHTVTAGFDVRSGTPLWSDSGSTVFCGAVDYDIAHPVRCRKKGTSEGGELSGLDVTLEGFDPRSGAVRWSWHAGRVEGLAESSGSGVLRISDVEYLIRNEQGAWVLHLDEGVRPLRSEPPVGWCSGAGKVPGVPGTTVPSGGENAYHLETQRPCTADGATVKVPRTAPLFAGARSGGVFVWVDEGVVRAVRVGLGGASTGEVGAGMVGVWVCG
ncbi:serine/threonine-protein kinase [Actinocorallia sp. API 0066]|uniref:serine/threonine-protein kinase n=1 Tax=Actinocorallia sp. API 0066 TaxID=2896846 RepID=UPI001E3B7448|nr:serine/threonine-protein kinase [Actinocorallia sp. API 0066]MCD0447958.1 serine/threonine-protein kinase [Actinocorallia sp. API 0066]